ncbi:MAG: NRDE family protein [Bacteroidales bacterium]|nr:NRDE family protein [Bacteroidales bacterium]
MCTVTYIPKGNDEFILTHNRDESVRRAIATPPITREINGLSHIFPVDPEGKGTWIGVSETNRVAGLMNGGLNKHKHNPPYRHSRGLVILSYFEFDSFNDFYNNYDFTGLEPFTLLVHEAGRLYELINDEQFLRVKHLDPAKPHIYSSTPLYSKECMMKRRERFFGWYNKVSVIKQPEIIDLHRSFIFEKEDNRLPLNVIIRTVSITSINKMATKAEVDYNDLINDVHLRKAIKFRKTAPVQKEENQVLKH